MPNGLEFYCVLFSLAALQSHRGSAHNLVCSGLHAPKLSLSQRHRLRWHALHREGLHGSGGLCDAKPNLRLAA